MLFDFLYTLPIFLCQDIKISYNLKCSGKESKITRWKKIFVFIFAFLICVFPLESFQDSEDFGP